MSTGNNFKIMNNDHNLLTYGNTNKSAYPVNVFRLENKKFP